MYHCKSYEIVLLYKASFLLREFCGIKILILKLQYEIEHSVNP